MVPDRKILELHSLARRVAGLKRKGKRVVLCHGTFDLMHLGHIRHLKRARQEGDILCVTVTGDAYVNKGPGRPIFPQQLRAESLASLECVDFVAINPDPTAVPVIHLLKPDVYVKGREYEAPKDDITGNIIHECNAVESFGGRVCFTDEIIFSSTNLINEHLDIFPPSTKAFLTEFKNRFSSRQVIELTQSLQRLKVLVVGEAIVDEYCYSTPLGLTGKSGNVLSVQFHSTEQFPGGSLAIANHLSGFCSKVTLLTGLGRSDRLEPFIRQRLSPVVEPVFYYFEKAPTLVKRRLVDLDATKLFEIYFYDKEPLTPEVDEAMTAWIREHAAEYDVVVAADFGNGLISPAMVKALCEHSRFLAVNTQINSGNRGYHVITRYPRADFVSLNQPEVRLAAHNRHDPLEKVTLDIGRKVHARHMAITLGPEGALFMDTASGTPFKVPALATKVVDIIGAGDAFLSLSAIGVGGGLDPDLAAFLGSAAAALDVQIVCNREAVTPVSLYKYITTLLK
ncbi:MAG: adenylyltransferase/cytidyltransferase family protein [Magnetococcales bacterium]|nr:adenylyltransferase/cytidyltransferase family protein [Magnetococcales bacterium]